MSVGVMPRLSCLKLGRKLGKRSSISHYTRLISTAYIILFRGCLTAWRRPNAAFYPGLPPARD